MQAGTAEYGRAESGISLEESREKQALREEVEGDALTNEESVLPGDGSRNECYTLQSFLSDSTESEREDDVDSSTETDSDIFTESCCSGRTSSTVSSSTREESFYEQLKHKTILTYEQVNRVSRVLDQIIALGGQENSPPLELKLKDLLTSVQNSLLKEGLKIRDIRLNGGAASYALMPERQNYCYCHTCGSCFLKSNAKPREDFLCSCSYMSLAGKTFVDTLSNAGKFTYNDIDVIFGMELSTADHFDRVKTSVLTALFDLFPPLSKYPYEFTQAYVSKMVKVFEEDQWSLIALGNEQHNPLLTNYFGVKGVKLCSVELKFVDCMKRQYEFSVDSFQIVLNNLLRFSKYTSVSMCAKFFPTVIGESVYGDFNEALSHLHHSLIATRRPEQIRGGGLLKFCNLLVKGYRPADEEGTPRLEICMCSRFFIDFPELEQQEFKLRTYITNHMSGDGAKLRYAFLMTLHRIIQSCAVYLIGHDETLQLIQRIGIELFTNNYCYYQPSLSNLQFNQPVFSTAVDNSPWGPSSSNTSDTNVSSFSFDSVSAYVDVQAPNQPYCLVEDDYTSESSSSSSTSNYTSNMLSPYNYFPT